MRVLKQRRMLGTLLLTIGLFGLLMFSNAFVGNARSGCGYFWGPSSGVRVTQCPLALETKPTSLDRAVDLAKQYVASLGNPDLDVKEVMEFELNFYFIVYEKSTGVGAFEMLIDPYGGRIRPEPGPNMMWNTKYGMMGRGMSGMMGGSPYRGAPTTNMPVTVEQAEKIAAEFLESYFSGATIEDPDTFYGYYTIHVLKEGKVYGMLSVNGYTGQVWYHDWHGTFVAMKELH